MKRRMLLGMLASMAGVSLWAYVVLTTSIHWIDSSYEFGLFQVLPPWLWIGLLLHLAGILATIYRSSEHVFLVQIFFLNLMIWGTPVFVESNARIVDSWHLLGTTKTILDSGRMTITNQPTHFYLQYPLSFIFGAENLLLSAIPPPLFLRIFPLISSSVFYIGLYAWIRKTHWVTGFPRFVILALLPLNVWLSFHYSPQSFGLMLLPLILLSLEKRESRWTAVGTFLMISMVIFHPTSSFILLAILVVQYVLLKTLAGGEMFVASRVLLFVVTWIGWLIWGAYLFFEVDVPRALRNLSEIYRYGLQANVEFSRATGHLPATIRLITIGSLLSVAAIYLLRNRKNRKLFAWNAGWVLACFLVMVADFAAFHGDFGNRSLMFVSFVLPIMLVNLIWGHESSRKTRNVVLVAAGLLLLFNMSTLYYYENYNIISESNLCASKFLSEKYDLALSYDRLIAHQVTPIYYYDTEAKWYYWLAGLNVSALIHQNVILVYDKYTVTAEPIPDLKETMMEIYNACENRVGISRTYSSGGFEIYYVEWRHQ